MNLQALVLLLIVAGFFFSVPRVYGQETSLNPVFEYGGIRDLKGVTKIFIYTGVELGLRNNIAKNIKKKVKNLIITDRPEDADIILLFAEDWDRYLVSVWQNTQATVQTGDYSGSGTTTTTTTPVYQSGIHGSGLVVKHVSGSRFRLLMQFKDSKSWLWERDPSTNFARAFANAYKKANGEDH